MGKLEKVATPELPDLSRETKLLDITKLERGNFHIRHSCCHHCLLKWQCFSEIQAAWAENWSEMKSSPSLTWRNPVLLNRGKNGKCECENRSGKTVGCCVQLSQLLKTFFSSGFRPGKASFQNLDAYLEYLLLL